MARGGFAGANTSPYGNGAIDFSQYNVAPSGTDTSGSDMTSQLKALGFTDEQIARILAKANGSDTTGGNGAGAGNTTQDAQAPNDILAQLRGAVGDDYYNQALAYFFPNGPDKPGRYPNAAIDFQNALAAQANQVGKGDSAYPISPPGQRADLGAYAKQVTPILTGGDYASLVGAVNQAEFGQPSGAPNGGGNGGGSPEANLTGKEYIATQTYGAPALDLATSADLASIAGQSNESLIMRITLLENALNAGSSYTGESMNPQTARTAIRAIDAMKAQLAKNYKAAGIPWDPKTGVLAPGVYAAGYADQPGPVAQLVARSGGAYDTAAAQAQLGHSAESQLPNTVGGKPVPYAPPKSGAGTPAYIAKNQGYATNILGAAGKGALTTSQLNSLQAAVAKTATPSATPASQSFIDANKKYVANLTAAAQKGALTAAQQKSLQTALSKLASAGAL